ncbi:MAG TPA: spore cortex biosynthesis protein YabQ [Clostridia bacterium]|nr:spore cortex biosynthesis protein YabQ [Clostridia bacterium]
MVPVWQQLQFFFQTILIGIVVGILVDFYRTVRRLSNPRQWITITGDFIFWVFLTVLVFYFLLLVNWGQVRAYVFIGMIIGLLVYAHFFSPFVLLFWFRFMGFCLASVKFLLSVVLFPFRLLRRIMVFPLGLISLVLDFFRRLVKGLGKRLNFHLKKGFSRIGLYFQRKRH